MGLNAPSTNSTQCLTGRPLPRTSAITNMPPSGMCTLTASDPAKVATYGDRFATLVSHLRKELNAPKAPVVMGELGRFRPASKAYNDALPSFANTESADRYRQRAQRRLRRRLFPSARRLLSRRRWEWRAHFKLKVNPTSQLL